MSAVLWIDPVDVLFLRTHQLFGAPGDDAAAQFPPAPSVVAGAVRSALLALSGAADLVELSQSGHALSAVLGLPETPGTFRLTGLWVARRHQEHVEILHRQPADVVSMGQGDGGLPWVGRMVPFVRDSADGFYFGSGTGQWLPLLTGAPQGKARSPGWLTTEGWRQYLSGNEPAPDHLISTEQIWTSDRRLGIGLDPEARSTVEGQIYTTDAVALGGDYGLVARIDGVSDATWFDALPLLRLGGDGRGAAAERIDVSPILIDFSEIESRWPAPFALVAVTPVLAADAGGQILPPGTTIDAEGPIWRRGGITADVRAAIIPRNDAVSGWDLPRHAPKPYETAAPAGSVWWLEPREGTAAELKEIVKSGLWPDRHDVSPRQAEGFNQVAVAALPDKLTFSAGERHV